MFLNFRNTYLEIILSNIVKLFQTGMVKGRTLKALKDDENIDPQTP